MCVHHGQSGEWGLGGGGGALVATESTRSLDRSLARSPDARTVVLLGELRPLFFATQNLVALLVLHGHVGLDLQQPQGRDDSGRRGQEARRPPARTRAAALSPPAPPPPTHRVVNVVHVGAGGAGQQVLAGPLFHCARGGGGSPGSGRASYARPPPAGPRGHARAQGRGFASRIHAPSSRLAQVGQKSWLMRPVAEGCCRFWCWCWCWRGGGQRGGERQPSARTQARVEAANACRSCF